MNQISYICGLLHVKFKMLLLLLLTTGRFYFSLSFYCTAKFSIYLKLNQYVFLPEFHSLGYCWNFQEDTRPNSALLQYLYKKKSSLGALLAHGLVPQVVLPDGTLQGFPDKTYNNRPYTAFEGIPYARPPVGKYRFRVSLTQTSCIHQLTLNF